MNDAGSAWQQFTLEVETQPRRFIMLTREIEAMVGRARLRTGLAHLFLRHTSASLCITENADPTVRADLERFAARLAPDGDPLFRHDDEGPDDMPGHIRTLIMGHELTVPIRHGTLALGTWQGIYLWEHRQRVHRRELVITLNGIS